MAYNVYADERETYYTDDLAMIERYTYEKAEQAAQEKGLKVWQINLNKYDTGEIKSKIFCMTE